MATETKILNPYIQGKVIQSDYDFITSLTGECLYCLTDSQVQMILSIVDYFGWYTRWYSESGLVDQSVITGLKDDLVERLIMSCCGDETPIQFRYSEDGVLQKSTDGGTTWEDAPQDDVRNNSTRFPPIPPIEGEDIKCLGATSAMEVIKQEVGEQITDDMSRYTLAQLIKDWVGTYIGTSNPFTALVTVIANQIFALVISALIAALTSGVYDKLKCAIFKFIEDDASYTESGVESLRTEILSEISGIAGIFLEHLVYLLGSVGMTNICRSGFATSGDCEGCDASCNVDLWSIKIYDSNPIGTMTTGIGYIDVTGIGHPDFPYAYNAMIQTMLESDCCIIDHIELLSGSMPILTAVNCGDALWPDSGTHGVSLPAELNTVYLHTDIGVTDPFVCRIHFQ